MENIITTLKMMGFHHLTLFKKFSKHYFSDSSNLDLGLDVFFNEDENNFTIILINYTENIRVAINNKANVQQIIQLDFALENLYQ